MEYICKIYYEAANAFYERTVYLRNEMEQEQFEGLLDKCEFKYNYLGDERRIYIIEDIDSDRDLDVLLSSIRWFRKAEFHLWYYDDMSEKVYEAPYVHTLYLNELYEKNISMNKIDKENKLVVNVGLY